MKREKFNSILASIIIPTFQKAYPENSLFSWGTDWQDSLFNAYNNEKDIIHKMMNDENTRIDRHKVVSAFIIAWLKVNPIVTTSVNPSQQMRMVNEVVAVLSSVKIMLHFYEEAQNDSNVLQKLADTKFTFPKSSLEDNYAVHLAKSLAKKKKNPNCFDHVFLSNILFLIEYCHLKHCSII